MGNNARVPWTRILAEVVAIVFSILLAFAIQAWWDETQLRRAEIQFLGDLTDEFHDNRDRLEVITGLGLLE